MTSSMLDDELVNKFVNCMMWGGEKSLSQKIFKLAMEEIKKEQSKNRYVFEIHFFSGPLSICRHPTDVFYDTFLKREHLHTIFYSHVCNFQVPSAINQRRRRFLAIKWLIKAARE
ncbi:unnamed protein product [Pocillopora meandrina]|uniref:Small ribosomal subunit protein uS7 domain-containing protein n=1 Tax=Pocillopora meandrina TaxID=46732 RepID=A0AAU9VWE5_9CNID|nr:unnamed protein product [Pocillopora meandrina]